MKCKSCGKPITTMSFGLAGVTATPNCKCGKIRLRERLRGCSACGARLLPIDGDKCFEIQITKKWYGYLLFCTCGKKWRVWK